MATKEAKQGKAGRRRGWILAGVLALAGWTGAGGLWAQAQAGGTSSGLQGTGADNILVGELTGIGLPAGTCVPSATALCLGDSRFRVTVNWRQTNGTTGVGSVVAGSSSDSGLFWFFSSTNYEMMVKVLNACGVNNRYWIFFMATTNVGFTLTVTDTMTGQSKTYQNTAGVVSPVITDTNALAVCP